MKKEIACVACGVVALVGVELAGFNCEECHHFNIVHTPHEERVVNISRDLGITFTASVSGAADSTIAVSPSPSFEDTD